MFEFQRVVDEILNATPEKKAWVFAHLVVPAIVVAVLLGLVTVPGLVDEDTTFAVIPLESVYRADRSCTPRSGVAIILEPGEGSLSIPWGYGSATEIWTSLPREAHVANADRLRIDVDRIAADLPLLGPPEPVLLVAEGTSKGDISIRRNTTALAAARLRPRQSGALATWAMVVSLFGAALTSVSSVNRPAPN